MQTSAAGRTLRLFAFLVLVSATAAQAQYFGRNKVQWEKFDFKILRTEHFDIYYYDDEKDVVDDVGRMAERWYTRLSRVFNHEFGRKPIVLYANSADFHQTTTTPGLIGEGTGGFTDEFQNRVVLPLTGSYAENDHVLGHELVHVFQYELAARGSGRGRRFAINNLPLWLIEGTAEYFSKGRVDPLTAMWIRDAALRDKLPDLRKLNTDPRYFPYRYGQALMAYIGGTYGDQAVVDLYLASGTSGVEQGIAQATGVDHRVLFAEWHAAAKQLYQPVAEQRPSALGNALLEKKTTRGDLNIAPSISPDGRYIAFLSTRELFSIDLWLAEAASGKIVGKLVSAESDPHFDALRFIDSSGSWSPDSRRLVFVTYERGDNRLAIIDVESRSVVERIEVPGVPALSNPAWSPDGKTIAFSGQSGGVTDIYTYDLETRKVRQLMSDKFADLQPAWSPDGRMIAFASDRSATSDLDQLRFGDLRIFTVNVETGAIRNLPLFNSGKHINPQFAPDGRSVYFVANPQGISDLYRYSYDTGALTQLTSVQTGISGITELSPAMTVSLRSGTVAFSVYERDDHNVYTLPAEATGKGVGADGGAVLATAAVLPPARPAERGSVTAYLQRPELGLPPATTQFERRDYDPKLRLTYLGPPTIGIGADRFGYGVGGTVSAYYSDVLGYHNVGFTIQGGDSSSTNFATSIGGELFYLNQQQRFNWGGRLSHIPYVTGFTYIEERDVELDGVTYPATVLSQERDIVLVDELSALSQYPFSATRRFEAAGGYQRYAFSTEVEERIYIGGSLADIRVHEIGDSEAFNMARGSVAFVGDSSTFGFISPIRGTRYRYELEALSGDLSFMTATADWRRYFYMNRITFAVRGLHFGRYGDDAENPRIRPLYVGSPTLVRGYELGSFSASECGDDNTTCPVFERLVGSRIGVASAELRVPLFGVREFGLISGAFLPTEFVAFADGGAAWDDDETPELKFKTDTTERVPVFSAGVAVRILLGYIPVQFYYAKPFQRPERDWEFGFVISPGW